MGNSASSPSPAPKDVPSLQKMLVDFLDKSPGDSALSLFYTPLERGQDLFPGLRVPSLGGDLCEFRQILLLLAPTADCVEQMDDACCNLITAALFRTSKPEKLLGALFYIMAGSLGAAPVRSTVQDCVVLSWRTLLICRAIVRAVGGDTALFPSVTVWSRRLQLLHHLATTIESQMDTVADAECLAGLERGRVGDEVEVVVGEMGLSVMLRLMGKGHWEGALEIGEAAIAALEQGHVVLPSRLLPLFALLLGRCLIRTGSVDRGALMLVSFAGSCDASCLETLGASGGEPSAVLGRAVRHCMQCPEIAGSSEALCAFGSQALGLLADGGGGGGMCRDELAGQLAAAYTRLGAHGEAHGCLIEMDDAVRRRAAIHEFVQCLVGKGAARELGRFVWHRDAETIEQALVSVLRGGRELRLSQYQPLYAWHVSQGNLRAAASVMYQFADRCAGAEGEAGLEGDCYYALQLAVNNLALTEPASQWLAIIKDGFGSFAEIPAGCVRILKIVDMDRMRAELLFAKACIESGYACCPRTTDQRGVVSALLRKGRLRLALDLVQEQQSLCHSDLILAFLLDPLAANPSWIDGFVAAQPRSQSASDLAQSVLRGFLASMDRTVRGEAYRYVFGRVAADGGRVPAWLLEDLRAFDCDLLVRMLCARADADTAGELVRDAAIAGTLAPGTRASWQLLQRSAAQTATHTDAEVPC